MECPRGRHDTSTQFQIKICTQQKISTFEIFTWFKPDLQIFRENHPEFAKKCSVPTLEDVKDCIHILQFWHFLSIFSKFCLSKDFANEWVWCTWQLSFSLQAHNGCIWIIISIEWRQRIRETQRKESDMRDVCNEKKKTPECLPAKSVHL